MWGGLSVRPEGKAKPTIKTLAVQHDRLLQQNPPESGYPICTLMSTSSGKRGGRGLAPEILEPVRRKLGVAHGVLDVAMAEPGLQRPRVVAGVGQGIATCVPEHVWMYRELHLGPSPDPTE